MSKVNVLQVEDVKFGRFSRWSNWVDVCVFDRLGHGYLLQMKVSRRNAKKFRCVEFKAWHNTFAASTMECKDLTKMNGE